MEKKTVKEAGADARTPSIPQYFSWVNNTNEGSTEKQTLINLDFFAWLKREYGMQIKIYAWDAGNFDGAAQGYGDPNGVKFRSQYPNGYEPVVKRAEEIGIRMGLWGSPDGFGNTPEEEKARYDFMVDLCRKYHFALFKIDAVCGRLRPEKAEIFGKMLRECREYSPDLIVLNHRLELYSAEKYATTFLWQGAETYCDVHSANRKTGPHNRCWIFERGLPVGEDGLLHLAEDHGVCLSSSLDFFGDDLIIQAFGRSLILAPEIYANPWLLRDDEYPLLARIYNLHRKAAPILVDGFPLPESYGPSAVARGSASHRFVVLGNGTWNEKTVRLSFRECGYAGAVPSVRLIRRYPTETVLGDYPADGSAEVTLRPFRAYLFEIAPKEEAFPVLENSEYTVVREAEDGTPKEIRRETIPGAPVLLGSMIPAEVPQAEVLLEAARFGVDNDSLEARSLRRSGPSSVPEVNACRDAFFSQHTYLSRGPEGRFAFDGRNDTFFDGLSRTFPDSLRVMGGCLRVDAGEILDCDTVEIDCFDPDTPVEDCWAAQIPEKGEYSEGLDCWKDSGEAAVSVKNASFTAPVIRFGYDISTTAAGRILTVSYRVGPLRRFRLKEPMDRIYAIRFLKNGTELPLCNPFVNNLMPHPSVQSPVSVHKIDLTLPEISEGDWLAVAAEGVHGWESAWCVADFGSGEPVGFPARAPAYPANVWEARVRQTDANYTFYLPLKKEDSGKKVCLYGILCDPERTDVRFDVWHCSGSVHEAPETV